VFSPNPLTGSSAARQVRAGKAPKIILENPHGMAHFLYE
jgi:hypothetical protein